MEVKVPKILIDLIPQYLENRKQELSTLDDALTKSDFDIIQSIGHKLKGNAGSYGFTDLTEIGLKIENAAKSKDSGTLKTAIASYKDYLANLKVVPA